MAKVKGPLFSLGATGKLANSLVYMTWKGIDDVRKYVIPANPKSAGQITQRGYLKAAVLRWHVIAWNAADLVGFNNWAAIASSAMSGFNRFVKGAVDALVAGSTLDVVAKMVVSAVTTTGFAVAAEGTAAKTYTLKYVTSSTAMVNTAAVTNTDGVLTATLAGLTLDTVYYFQIYCTTAAWYAYSGIIKQKTAAV